MISDRHLNIVDSQDREYSVDSDALLAVEDSFTFEQLDPDVSKEGTLVYNVPENQ